VWLTADLGLAVAAGLVAAINPCGFALLPVYLTLLPVMTARSGGGGAVLEVNRPLARDAPGDDARRSQLRSAVVESW
jgi:cytochrome c biogenesis protein CcdA